MLHAVERNERACSTQASLAMDSDGSLFLLGLGQELGDDFIWRGSSVQEVQIQVLDPILDELLLVVLGLVEAHHKRHSHLLEDGHVVFWREGPILVRDIEGA